jgi:two-component system sensor histidine kinase BaeS
MILKSIIVNKWRVYTVRLWRSGVRLKLLVAITTSTLLLVAMMGLGLHWGFQHGFIQYLLHLQIERLQPLIKALEYSYAQKGNWEPFISKPWLWRQWMHQFQFLLRNGSAELTPPPVDFHPEPPPWAAHDRPIPPAPPPPGTFAPPPRHGHPPMMDHKPARPPGPPIALLDQKKQPIAGFFITHPQALYHPLHHQHQLIGYLYLLPPPELTDAVDVEFQHRQTRLVIIMALLALACSLVIALPLAHHLLKPLHTLLAGLAQLTNGHYHTRIFLKRHDEFGVLATGFNHLAATLEQNKQLRQRLMADVSHELRTPLSILQGELAALRDGIRVCSPSALDSLQAEVDHITKLIEDLYQLALSDLGALNYCKTTLKLEPLLAQIIERRRMPFANAQLTIETQLSQSDHYVLADAARLVQLFENLLENSRRYTDAGGQLIIRTQNNNQNQVAIIFSDTAPGVPEAALAHLFEHLYRVEPSRTRRYGGAGLGLAMCANIVQAHNGSISAQHDAELGGLRITILLPLLAHSA